MITLEEARQLLDKGQESMNNPDLAKFVDCAQEMGGTILQRIPNDDLAAAVCVIQGIVVADLLEDGHLEMAMIALSNSEIVGGMMAVALKVAVGLAAIEEWR